MAAVDEDGELDARRAAALEERLDRGADRAARIEDVVDEDARLSAQVEVELGRVDDGLAAAGAGVVAMEGDVDRAERDLLPAPLLDQGGQPLGERDAARMDSDERERAQVVVSLDDLVRDARERARKRLCVQQRFRGRPLAIGTCVLIPLPFRSRRTGLKGLAEYNRPRGRSGVTARR